MSNLACYGGGGQIYTLTDLREVWSWWSTDYPACDAHSIEGDPGLAFVPPLVGPGALIPDRHNGSYWLLHGSPCIDTGNPNFPFEMGETDMDGETRIMGCNVDMGADEFTIDDPVPGDFDRSGILDMPDLPLFVESLLDPTLADVCIGDTNDDQLLNGEDVQLFVDVFLGA